MSKIPFEFGELLYTNALLSRQTKSNFRFWQRIPCAKFKVIYLGHRTLYDGIYEPGSGYNYPDFEPEHPYLKTTKTHKAALVCRKGHKPEYVFLEDLEKIND